MNPAATALIFTILAFFLGSPADTPAARTPVVVELFTSEGCSSCPPADALLMQLEAQSPSGTEIIALGEHVDYWDRLGWKDRFSSTDYTHRQERYASRFRLDSAYTPQMIINGRTEFVGNDSSHIASAIRDAAKSRHTTPIITLHPDSTAVDVSVNNAGRNHLDVFLALTESDLSTQVGAGENNGHLLRHTAVVRRLRKIGKTSSGQFTSRPEIAVDPSWRRENLRVVVFLQDPDTLEITAAAQTHWK